MERHSVTTAFFFLRPTDLVYELLSTWAKNLAGLHTKGEQPALAKALRGDLSKAMDLAILPMAAFPSGSQILVTDGPQNELHEVSDSSSPAWLMMAWAKGLHASWVGCLARFMGGS